MRANIDSATSLTCFVLLASAVGCSSRPYEVAPVSGTITLDQQPLAGAIINTQPLATANSSSPGPGSFGKTDTEGKFELELVSPAEPGAVVGQHRVVIRIPEKLSATDELNPRSRDEVRLPVAALDGSLRLDVPAEGLTTADFQLKSRK